MEAGARQRSFAAAATSQWGGRYHTAAVAPLSPPRPTLCLPHSLAPLPPACLLQQVAPAGVLPGLCLQLLRAPLQAASAGAHRLTLTLMWQHASLPHL